MKQSTAEKSENVVAEKMLTPEEHYAQGFYHQYGFKGHEKDLQEACKHYTLAADDGRIDAEYSLGVVFEQSHNYAEAFKWYRLALKRGDEFAAEGYKCAAKKLGYEGVVSVLRNMNEITHPLPPRAQSITALLPSDSPLVGKGGSNRMRNNDSHEKRITLIK